MRILFTNTELKNYAGTEVVVRDLAREFLRRGHTPQVYSPKLGAIAEEIRGLGVEVTDRLATLSGVPDIIHGHHHAQVVEALLHFSSAPAVLVCHSARAPIDEPFYFPRIRRYVAVDELCRQRLLQAPGIPPARVEVIANAVDLERFQPRPPLPERPRRALVFSNYTRHLPAVALACRRVGLEFDIAGLAGQPTARPEELLPRYDLVFAKARCALEAMAVGTAVVLCDFTGAGPMVTSGEFDALRRMNFGAGVLRDPLRSRFLFAQIERYDPQDAAAVSRRVRSEAGLATAAERWLALYAEAIGEFSRTPRDLEAEFRALGDYLEKWSYGKRLEWEREQLRRLEAAPLLGRGLARLARSMLRRWTGADRTD